MLLLMSKTELLINAIQERPILWDKRNKNYHNRLLSYREWENLATIAGTTSEMAKKKWKNLRDTFMKELKKIPKPCSGADADNEPKYTGTWPYFEAMSFLRVILKPRKIEGNILPITESSSRDLLEPTDTASLEEDLGEDLTSKDCTQTYKSMFIVHEMPHNTITDINLHQTTSPSPSTLSTRQKYKRKNDNDLEALIDIEREKIKILRQEQDSTDDDLHWFKSILPYMKQLPSMKKLKFRTQMQELLLTELSMINPPQSRSDNSSL